jgi:hypothetical protein
MANYSKSDLLSKAPLDFHGLAIYKPTLDEIQ